MKRRSILDWTMLMIVVAIAVVVILLSFHNTTILATELSLNPYLSAGLVEILFASLLLLRGKQRAAQRNVPTFLSIGYFTSLAFVTAVNVYGLSKQNLVTGCIVGLAISSAMWLMESVLVWLWVDSYKPYQRTVKDLEREAEMEIEEIKAIQRIEWMRYEAKKPDLDLILEARRAEERRKEIVGDGLPEFFSQVSEPIAQIIAEPVVIEVDVENMEKEKDNKRPTTPGSVVPIRTIGFHVETLETKPDTIPPLSPAPLFQPNVEATELAIEKAKALREELGRTPLKRELMDQGISDHYARKALKAISE